MHGAYRDGNKSRIRQPVVRDDAGSLVERVRPGTLPGFVVDAESGSKRATSYRAEDAPRREVSGEVHPLISPSAFPAASKAERISVHQANAKILQLLSSMPTRRRMRWSVATAIAVFTCEESEEYGVAASSPA